jgi:hypothetical protein
MGTAGTESIAQKRPGSATEADQDSGASHDMPWAAVPPHAAWDTETQDLSSCGVVTDGIALPRFAHHVDAPRRPVEHPPRS